MSVSHLVDKGYTITFSADESFIINSLSTSAKLNKTFLHRKDGLFYINKADIERLMPNDRCNLSSTTPASSLVTWHQRTHLSDDLLIKLSHGRATGIEINDEFLAHNLSVCEDCALTKVEKNNRRRRQKRSLPKNNLEQIDTDIKVVNIKGYNDEIYILSFRCIRSKFTWLYFLKQKSQAVDALKLFKINVLNQLVEQGIVPELVLKRIHSDGGGEFMGEFEDLCDELGIKHTLSPPYRPDLNSFAESYWRILMQTTRAFLSHADLPLRLWTQACSYANYILNRTLLRPIDGKLKTSFEILMNTKPDLTNIRTWGTECYSFIPEEGRLNNSLSNRGKIGYFIGFSDNYVHSVNIYHPDNGITPHKIEDVIFNEIIKPRLHVDSGEQAPLIISEDVQSNSPIKDTDADNAETETVEKPQKRKQQSTNEKDSNNKVRRSYQLRGRHVPVYNVKDHSSMEKKVSKLSPKELEVIQKAEDEYLTPEMILEWINAIEKEKTSLKLNDVYEVIRRPAGRRILRTMWVLNKKYDELGNEIAKKARSVLLGNNEIEGIDYFETFSPVAKLSCLRLFLAVANQFKMYMIQGDVNTAFLNAEIDEEILIELPLFFNYSELLESLPENHPLKNEDHSNLCIRLKKSQYGLKQSSRNWFLTINKFLIDIGFKPCKSEPCIYWYRDENVRALFFLYVDDFIIASTSKAFSEAIMGRIKAQFKIKVLGFPKTILGISVIKKGEDILIHQRKKIEDLAKEYKLLDSKPVVTPLDADHKLRKNMFSAKDKQSNYQYLSGEELEFTYRSIVGKLNHISQATRPDIAYSVATLSKYLNNPSISHLYAAKRVIKYLYHTRNRCIRYRRNSTAPLELLAYSDSDWAGDQDNRRSHSGSILMIAEGPLHWCSSVQHTIALSSAEAEIIALKQTTKDTLWMKNLMQEVYMVQRAPIRIFEDNSSTIKIVTNPMISKKNRHMEINYYFIMEHVEIGTIQVIKVSGEHNIADILTKYYREHIHNRFVAQLFVDIEQLQV